MKILFIKPNLEIDAVWDPIRTCNYIGIWGLASLLIKKGHNVVYLDETVRENGLSKKSVFIREIDKTNNITEQPLGVSYKDFQNQKIEDYSNMTSRDFIKKYSAFREGTIRRVMVKVGLPEEETLQKVEEEMPDYVGIPLIASANYLSATRLARKIKKTYPQIKIIFGGQHVSSMPNEFLKENPWIDHIVIGDGITVIEGIINGTIKEKIIYGGFQEMDEFPLLNPEVIKDTNYPLTPNHSYATQGRKWIDFMFSRGCHRKCDFCVAGSTPGCHITATDYDLLDEQLRVLKGAGYQELIVQDDAFLWDKRHLKQHLPKILSLMKKYEFFWQNNGGIDFEATDEFVINEILKYNQDGISKCTSLYIPFNPRGWNKNQSASRSMIGKFHDNLKNLKKLREAGIYIFTSSILGTPEQTPETFIEELKSDQNLITEGYIDSALPLSATMLPGTKWFANNGHNIINKKDYSGYSLFATHHRTDYFQAAEIEELMICWLKGLDKTQKAFFWQTAFPNS
jgi:radical SAM superfamily enzyme YgiQ (UPF0313 family)